MGQIPEWVVYMKDKLEKSVQCQCKMSVQKSVFIKKKNRKNNLKIRTVVVGGAKGQGGTPKQTGMCWDNVDNALLALKPLMSTL